MAGYLGNIPTPQATQTRDTFTATASQTSFATSGYTVGMLDVYLNGIKLASADFTASNGSDVVLASGASTGDIVEVVSFSTFDSASGAFSVDVQSDKIKTATIAHTNNTTAMTINTAGVVLQPTKPCFRANKNTGNTAIANSTDVKIAYDTEQFDIGGYYDHSTNYRYTPLVAGKYFILARVYFTYSSAATENLVLSIRKNNSVYARNHRYSADELYGSVEVTTLVDMNGSSDYLDVYGLITTSSDASYYANDYYGEFSGYLIG